MFDARFAGRLDSSISAVVPTDDVYIHRFSRSAEAPLSTCVSDRNTTAANVRATVALLSSDDAIRTILVTCTKHRNIWLFGSWHPRR
jgi:hypothetical protein